MDHADTANSIQCVLSQHSPNRSQKIQPIRCEAALQTTASSAMLDLTVSTDMAAMIRSQDRAVMTIYEGQTVKT